MTTPPLKNNCFAMPPGVDWTSVDDALAQIQDGLHTVVESETIPIFAAYGRIVSIMTKAKRSNPPTANSAVDGYGFCYDSLPNKDIIKLPLEQNRAIAGKAYSQKVQSGFAIRILTGATIPLGVDTVILEEDVSLEDNMIHFRQGLKKGANLRKAAEDVGADDVLFDAGHRLRAQDLAILAATGVDRVSVYKKLRVAVISTGTELVQVGNPASADQIYDANKPMLLSLLDRWGYDAVDGGHIKDDPALIRAGLNQAANMADAVFITGGASAGDEDYVSKLLKDEGNLQTWRVAIKPGRPLAMALWNGIPCFGYPGNPVAAFVCALVFGLPALKVLSGQTSLTVNTYQLPAAFIKNKKPGRREYLRARVNKGAVEVFKSEGSGRISGLSWSDGLVELPDEACDITKGDLVTYIPYTSFGL